MITDSLSIGFLLGSPDINGGTYVIYEHASRLKDAGHDVSIITQEAVAPERYSWHSSAHKLQWLTLDTVAQNQFDVVFATWWQSPYLLHQLAATHYVYFVQSIESRFFKAENPLEHDEKDLSLWQDFCESTYSLNIPVITEAGWIKEYLYEHYNRHAHLVRNGIRKDIYRKDGDAVAERIDGKLRVLVEGPVDVFYKNVRKSIELSRQADVDEVWLLTSSDIDSFPGVDRVFSRVPIHDTPAIYRSCDVLVKLSYVEGMFGPPLEMFHCGGTAIVYDVTGHDEYIVHDQNGLVVARDDDDQIVAYLKELQSQKGVLERLKAGAEATALAWPDWAKSSKEFEKALLKIVQGAPVSRSYIQRHIDRLHGVRDNAFAARELHLFSARESTHKQPAEPENNFIQLYWHEGENFSQEKCLCQHYSPGAKVNASFEIKINNYPFWIRLDPSVRIGMVCLDSIRVVHVNSNREALSFNNPADFNAIDIGGTCSRLPAKKATYFSYGSDPQLVLPPIEKGGTGDTFRVEITLQESGIYQFVEEACAPEERGKVRKMISSGLARMSGLCKS